MDRPLGPLPNWKIRWIVFGVIVVLSAIILGPRIDPSTAWIGAPASLAMYAALVGSARDSRVVGAELVTQLFIAFIPLKPERFKLKYVVLIEAQNRRDMGGADWLLFAGFHFVMDRIMQWPWPWLAGELELFLVTAREKRVLAWRGNSERAFQANLATLTSATGAKVQRQ
jgi:hypothetical protein